MTEAIKISELGQVAVTVEDLPRAEAFYRDVLGFKHLFNAGESMTFFDCGGMRLMLGLAETAHSSRGGTILYFRVANIAAAFKALTDAGVHIVVAPHCAAKMPDYDLWLGFFKDGEGNTLSLMSEIPRS